MKNKMVMYALGEYTDEQIISALAENIEIIERHRGLKPPQSNAYWKAVENRLKLGRELVVRGIEPDVNVGLPDERLQFVDLSFDIGSTQLGET